MDLVSLEESYGYYCMPLWFREDQHHAPQVCASATLLTKSGDHYLVTAGHVRESLIETHGLPYVMTHDRSIVQFKYWKGFRSIDRDTFQPDIEYLHLLGEAKSFASFLRWIDCTQCCASDDTFDYYWAVGFAASKNKRPKLVSPGMTLKLPSSTHFRCDLHPYGNRVLDKLGYDLSNHIVVSFKRRSYKNDGMKITAPHPGGMSGGALIGIKTDGDKTVALLCGIITEYDENRSAIISTKIDLIHRMLQPYRNDV